MKKEEVAKKFGERVAKLRTKKGWSQAELARACEKDRQSIERIEKGATNPTLYTIAEIAEALGVNKATLLDF